MFKILVKLNIKNVILTSPYEFRKNVACRTFDRSNEKIGQKTFPNYLLLIICDDHN